MGAGGDDDDSGKVRLAPLPSNRVRAHLVPHLNAADHDHCQVPG